MRRGASPCAPSACTRSPGAAPTATTSSGCRSPPACRRSRSRSGRTWRAMLALSVLAVAAAAALPSTTTPGVSATRSGGGRVTIRFADTAAGQKAYRQFAGRRVTIRCQHVGSDLLYGSGATDVVIARARFGRTLSTVTLRVRGTTNLCALGSPLGGVVVATSGAGRRFLADLRGLALLDVAGAVERRGATAALRTLKSHGERLSSST